MKLDQDCVRDLLLYFEESLELNSSIDILKINLKKYESETIIYTALKLTEAEYINAVPKYASNGLYFFPVSSITWNGHKFLDTIRDNEVWSETKSIASKFSSVSLNMIENIATQVITNIISKQMGLL